MMTVKRCSEIRLFRDFAVRTFWTYICYDGHVFFQKVQFFYVDFRIYQKIWKKFFFFCVIVFEVIAVNSHHYDWQSMCQQTILRVHISLTETFYNSISVRALEKYD